jgi:hypothetical protein
MNESTRSHIPTEAILFAMHGATASIVAASEEVYFNDRPRQRSSGEAGVPDEDGFETFVDGDGI